MSLIGSFVLWRWIMISKTLELLGANDRILQIARKLTQIEMWVSTHQMRWFLAQMDAILDYCERLRRAA